MGKYSVLYLGIVPPYGRSQTEYFPVLPSQSCNNICVAISQYMKPAIGKNVAIEMLLQNTQPTNIIHLLVHV